MVGEKSNNVFCEDSSSIMPEEFPEVQGGGSLILAWQIRNKRVLVVGGGEVSQSPAKVLPLTSCLTYPLR